MVGTKTESNEAAGSGTFVDPGEPTRSQANLPFPKSEYARRQRRVMESMSRAGLDGLVVTSHKHLQYLTGYDGNGAYRFPFPLILVPGLDPVFVVREFDAGTVRAESCIDEIATYPKHVSVTFASAAFATATADVLRRFGIENKRVGFELGCWNLAPADVSALEAELPSLNVVDASRLIALVSAVKGELELKAMRQAMALTDLAMRTFQNSLHEGVTEIEVSARIREAVAGAGGGDCFIAELVFGERVKEGHGHPKANPLQINQPAVLELGCENKLFYAPLARGAVLGAHPETESLYGLSIEALESAISVMKPGVTARAVYSAKKTVLEKAGRSNVEQMGAGYQVGFRWMDTRAGIDLAPGETDVLEEGMTFHMPFFLCSERGYRFGCSETVLITAEGAEILSDTPRALFRA